ncbi:hypothetical protein LZY01_07730 [Levilactobacillus zymae]|uniref:Uncharacterized protein n=1 Tax=Levilactobacillus zymae TaxID=267363 RepID=A0ABQ0WUS1_9LACO|nr:hypothetical protein LZY01_07730 [Levilactobacillus zymae]
MSGLGVLVWREICDNEPWNQRISEGNINVENQARSQFVGDPGCDLTVKRRGGLYVAVDHGVYA